ncbi:unnamed protein product [Clavelina lepadiformis]|uniref:C-type lectin domain-containing protein n=1 Tax=Clavelina lepadiformis TaxID=159417 RepID=A0ABP0H3T4_CLALP
MLLIQYKLSRDSRDLYFWIGLTDRREEGIFQWTRCQDGVLSKASYVKWLPNEPDNGRNFLKANVTHDCVAWHWSYESGWADQYCEDTFPFICEVHLKEASTPKKATVSVPGSTASLLRMNLSSAIISHVSSGDDDGVNIIYIVSIPATVASVLIFMIVLLVVLKYGKKREGNRVQLLRRANIHPSLGGGRAFVRTWTGFGTPYSRSSTLPQ